MVSRALNEEAMPTEKEITAIRKKLQAEAKRDHEDRTREFQLAKYAKKSAKGAAKGSSSKAKRQDVYSKASRLPGAGFTKS